MLYRCLSYKRIGGKKWFEQLAIHRSDADRHSLTGIGRIRLDDQAVFDAGGREPRGERAQIRLIERMQRNRVGAVGDWF